MVEKILLWGDFSVWCLVLLLSIIITYYTFLVNQNKNVPVLDESKKNHFAILIPARNESKVIENILISITKQDFKIDMKDVYVIVESKFDPTVKIVENYGGTIFVRGNIENRRRKGYALDDCIKDIISKGLHYDAYFIFDADNTMEKDYFTQMNSTFNKGYDIACGYRRPTNPNANVVATSSALVFSMVNVFGNTEKAKKNYNVVITGTGFYIRGSIVESWGGYPFHTLTEDYELTLYSTWKKLSSTYNENAIYMDEQPTTMKQSFKQRVRWVAGYFEARKIYSKKIHESNKQSKNVLEKTIYSCGVIPIIIVIILLVLYILFCLGIAIASLTINDDYAYIDAFWRIGSIFVAIYGILVILTACLFYSERKKTKYTKKTIIKTLLYNPIFLASFAIAALKVLFSKKEITWDQIEHNGKKK